MRKQTNKFEYKSRFHSSFWLTFEAKMRTTLFISCLLVLSLSTYSLPLPEISTPKAQVASLPQLPSLIQPQIGVSKAQADIKPERDILPQTSSRTEPLIVADKSQTAADVEPQKVVIKTKMASLPQIPNIIELQKAVITPKTIVNESQTVNKPKTEKTDPLPQISNRIEPQTTTIKPDTIVIKPQTIVIKPETSGIEPQTIVVQPQIVVIEPQKGVTNPQTAVIGSMPNIPIPEVAVTTKIYQNRKWFPRIDECPPGEVMEAGKCRPEELDTESWPSKTCPEDQVLDENNVCKEKVPDTPPPASSVIQSRIFDPAKTCPDNQTLVGNVCRNKDFER
ncbi:uncharacterized protein LOC103519383 isoform X1 [Diaphorina citri]|uniref:Uncharacterized protein LOC103519383 isoform X1 n=2 Tax=Diaphorina citri TaxID=121845 RepID=A0A1S3DIN9_DIACI|nr:uncharacterized protein LOC103519383 isoform X1 [Diaphorina citri]